MDDSFFIYIERLELLAFFSGYPLIYFIVRLLGTYFQKKGSIKIKLVSFAPVTYALVGILYLGLQLKNLYPDYSFENIQLATQNPYLKIWALLSLVFFIPALAKRPVLSLLHSLVFFYFIVRDIFEEFFFHTDNNILQNDMHIYTRSLLVNLGAFIFIFLFYSIYSFISSKKAR